MANIIDARVLAPTFLGRDWRKMLNFENKKKKAILTGKIRKNHVKPEKGHVDVMVICKLQNLAHKTINFTTFKRLIISIRFSLKETNKYNNALYTYLLMN